MKKRCRCYISNARADTEYITKILDKLNVETIDIFNIPRGNVMIDEIINKIKDVDFIVCFIKKDSPDVYYELGIATGLGKPAFIIKEEYLDLPAFLKGTTYISESFKDIKIIKNALQKFIQQVSYIKKYNISKEKTRKKQIEPSKWIDIENKVVDLAIWSDNIEKTIGNPIFIETKIGDINSNIIKDAENQLIPYISKNYAKAGLILYLDRDGKRYNQDYSLFPLIFRLDIEDFVKLLKNKHFSNVILTLRNKMAHGGH